MCSLKHFLVTSARKTKHTENVYRWLKYTFCCLRKRRQNIDRCAPLAKLGTQLCSIFKTFGSTHPLPIFLHPQFLKGNHLFQTVLYEAICCLKVKRTRDSAPAFVRVRWQEREENVGGSAWQKKRFYPVKVFERFRWKILFLSVHFQTSQKWKRSKKIALDPSTKSGGPNLNFTRVPIGVILCHFS